ncbi:hypothetical protein OG21DRAFT_1524342 [Imleria badia]|nr:hypothetical protein OG21DRAFT_1524342 [Imleria badia]
MERGEEAESLGVKQSGVGSGAESGPESGPAVWGCQPSPAKESAEVELIDDILQPQPQSVHSDDVPAVLPPVITNFFADILGISSSDVDDLWDIAHELIWSLPSAEEEQALEVNLFQMHGHLSRITLYPPTKHCLNPKCSTHSTGTLLKKKEYRRIIVFTLAEGAQPAWSVSKHQFCAQELVLHWMDLLQVALAAQALNLMIGHSAHPCALRRFGTHSVSMLYWMIMHTMMFHSPSPTMAIKRIVSHLQCASGLSTSFYMAKRNCCMHVFIMPDGTLAKTEVAVTDGITIG